MFNIGDKVIAMFDNGLSVNGVIYRVVPTIVKDKFRYIVEAEAPIGTPDRIMIPEKNTALFMFSQENLELLSDQERGLDVDLDYIFA